MQRFDRGERRFQTARLKKKRQNYWGFNQSWNNYTGATPRQLGMLVQYPKACACYMCSMDRKFHGPSVAELSFDQRRLHD